MKFFITFLSFVVAVSAVAQPEVQRVSVVTSSRPTYGYVLGGPLRFGGNYGYGAPMNAGYGLAATGYGNAGYGTYGNFGATGLGAATAASHAVTGYTTGFGAGTSSAYGTGVYGSNAYAGLGAAHGAGSLGTTLAGHAAGSYGAGAYGTGAYGTGAWGMSAGMAGHGAGLAGHGVGLAGHGVGLAGHGVGLAGHGAGLVGHGAGSLGVGATLAGHAAASHGAGAWGTTTVGLGYAGNGFADGFGTVQGTCQTQNALLALRARALEPLESARRSCNAAYNLERLLEQVNFMLASLPSSGKCGGVSNMMAGDLRAEYSSK